MNEWVLIATCKQLVWSTRIGRNMPIWNLNRKQKFFHSLNFTDCIIVLALHLFPDSRLFLFYNKPLPAHSFSSDSLTSLPFKGSSSVPSSRWGNRTRQQRERWEIKVRYVPEVHSILFLSCLEFFSLSLVLFHSPEIKEEAPGLRK